MTKPNAPINPIIDMIGHVDFDGKQIYMGDNGLTKREYFAAMAMQGILASVDGPTILRDVVGHDQVAVDAVALADHLIDALDGEIG